MKKLVCLLMLAAGFAIADSNITGKWSGTFNITAPNGESKESTALLDLKQNGAEITGTVGPNEEERAPIQNGKIEGNKITLEAAHGGTTIKFNLVVASDRITGDAEMSREGEIAKAKLDLTRAK